MWGSGMFVSLCTSPYIAQKDGRIAGSNSENCTENARRQTSVSVKHQSAAKSAACLGWVNHQMDVKENR